MDFKRKARTELKRGLALSLTLVTLFSSTASALVVDVFAKANSTYSAGVGAATGITLAVGDAFTVSVAADDLWNAGALPRWSNADGLNVELFATGFDDSNEAAGTHIGRAYGLWNQYGLALSYGTLVGSIDNNFFAVGTNYNGNAVAAGELFLWYWDSNNFDNTEKITATVESSVISVPEPTSLALLVLGLLALTLRRRLSFSF